MKIKVTLLALLFTVAGHAETQSPTTLRLSIGNLKEVLSLQDIDDAIEQLRAAGFSTDASPTFNYIGIKRDETGLYNDGLLVGDLGNRADGMILVRPPVFVIFKKTLPDAEAARAEIPAYVLGTVLSPQDDIQLVARQSQRLVLAKVAPCEEIFPLNDGYQFECPISVVTVGPVVLLMKSIKKDLPDGTAEERIAIGHSTSPPIKNFLSKLRPN